MLERDRVARLAGLLLRGFRLGDLVSVSDRLPSTGGIEHRASSESDVPAAFFLHPEDLLPHELAHAWNGLYRQPADLWTPNFNVPMRDNLLWVYEGQTEFWGLVLAARAGLRTAQDTLDMFAIDAALVATRAGRAWKTLADTSNDPLFVIGQNVAWPDWQRREDYYPAGVMLWLDVDGILRGRSAGAKRLDDFAHAFFAVRDGDLATRTYTVDDLYQALTQLVPADWRSYLRARLDAYDDPHVLDGLQRAGYRLVFTANKTPAFR